MSSRIRFHPAARDELREAAIWYERARPGLGSEFHAEIEEVLDLLAERSLEGVTVLTPGGRSLAKVFLHRFPYAVYFDRLDDELVMVDGARITGGSVSEHSDRFRPRFAS